MAYENSNMLFAEKITLSTDTTGLTAEYNLRGKKLCGILIASTDWTAASLSLAVSPLSGGTFYPVHCSSGEVTRTGAASTYFTFDESEVAGLQFFKIRSGVAATPVAQAVARELYIFSQV